MKSLLLVTLAMLGLTTSTMAQNLPNYVPANGLVGWWPFNGNANDESGNGNNGTVISGLLSNDRLENPNSSYYLNGQTDYINVPSTSEMLPNNLSLSVWVKIPTNYSGNNGIGPIIRSRFYGYILWFDSSTHTVKQILHHNSALATTTSVSNNIDDNQWHHLVGSFDGNYNKLYLDAQLISIDSTNIGNMYYVPDGVVAFGRDGNNSSSSTALFQGWIDDIAIYNRALTQEEITALYTNIPVTQSSSCDPLPSNLQNGLVGYWPFCGNANDESGNGNDGTVNGATLTEDRFGAMGKAYDFDGMDDLIETTLTNIQTQNYTISCWYNSLLNIQGDQEISLVVSRDSPYATNGLYIYFIGGQPHYYFDRSRCYLSNTLISDTINLNNGTWNNYVAIFNNGFMSIYSNGILVDTLSTSEPLCVNGNFVFGNDNILPNRFFKGSLDDIGIWNRALSAEEVQQLYTINACTFTIYDTLTVNNYVTIYDTVSVSTTDTLIINTLITSVQPAQENTFLVYPNPANSHITIDYGNFAIMNGYQLKIENSIGQQVFQTNITQQTDYLSLNNWGGNGLYFVHIIDAQGNTIDIRKIVLQ